MKRLFAALLCLALALCCAALAEELAVTDYLAEQAEVDAMLLKEAEVGYPFDDPLVVVNPYGNAPLSAVAVFSTEEEVGGTITVKGREPEDDITGTFEPATTHFVPVYGLYEGGATRVELKLDDGRTSEFEVETEPVDLGFEDFSTEMVNEDLYDYDQLTICGALVLRNYAAYDSKGDMRWAITNTGANAYTPLDNGHFLIPNIYGHGAEFPNGLTGIREMDPMGKVYNAYVWNGGEHHEIIILPNGNYMVTGSRPNYVPTTRDYLFEIDPATGEIVWELDLAALVAPGSSGGENDFGPDWCHSNALAYDEQSDTLLISCRHICAVLAVNKTEKTLKWILGDPAGWAEEYQPYLLKAQGDDFGWSYGQHQVTIMENGDLLMFDNGEFGRVKKVNEADAIEDEDNYSRAVIYRVDEDAMTVRQVWSYGEDWGFYAGSMSGVECLDEAKGRYLITFGTCKDGDNPVEPHVRLIEGDKEVWGLDFSGNSVYRGTRGRLYGDAGSYDPRAVGQWHGDIGPANLLEDAEADTGDIGEALDGLEVARFPFNALRFSGSVMVGKNEKIPACLAVLYNDEETLCFDLGYTINNVSNGKMLNFSRWVSLNGLPAGTYHIGAVLNDGIHDTGKTVTVE